MSALVNINNLKGLVCDARYIVIYGMVFKSYDLDYLVEVSVTDIALEDLKPYICGFTCDKLKEFLEHNKGVDTLELYGLSEPISYSLLEECLISCDKEFYNSSGGEFIRVADIRERTYRSDNLVVVEF